MKKSKLLAILLPTIFAVAVVVAVTVLLLPSIRYSSEYKKYKFERNETGYSVVAYSGSRSTMQIPEKYAGKKVTEIASNAFAGERFSFVRKVVLPSNIKKIGENAFSGMRNLKKVIIPESCEIISKNAFFGCEDLAAVSFGKNTHLFEVGSGAFANTQLLKDFEASNNRMLIVDGVAIAAKRVVGAVVVPADVVVLSFDACAGLGKVGVSSLSVEENSKLVGVSAGGFAVCSFDKVDFSNASKLSYVGANCFADCASLRTVVFASSALEIGEGAFVGCSRIEKLDFAKANVVFDGKTFDSFENCNRLSISGECTSFVEALGNCSSDISSDLDLVVTTGTVSDEIVELFASRVKNFGLRNGAYISWKNLCSFELLEFLSAPAYVFDGATNETLIATNIEVFGTGNSVLSCDASVDADSLFVSGVAEIADEAFSGEGAQNIGFVSVDEADLLYVGKHAFWGTHWFEENNDECVCIGDFCVALRDVNNDGEVLVKEGAKVLCSGALVEDVDVLILASTLETLEDNAILGSANTVVFRSNVNNVVGLKRIGAKALCFDFENVLLQSTSDGETWSGTLPSVVLEKIEYVGDDAFLKTCRFFAGKTGFVSFGETILVDVVDFSGNELVVPMGIRVVASNCFDASEISPQRLVFSDSVVMIGKNYFGNKIRTASFGVRLKTINSLALFAVDSTFGGQIVINSRTRFDIGSICNQFSDNSLSVLKVKIELVDFYAAQLSGKNVKVESI